MTVPAAASVPDGQLLLRQEFTEEDQHAFATISGDANPIHLDAAAARREFYGRRILHGLHGALTAAEAVLARRARRAEPALQLRALRGRFLGPVFLGEPVDFLVSEHELEVQVEVRAGGAKAYDLRFLFAPGAAAEDADVPGPTGTACANRDFSSLAMLRGGLPLWLDDAAYRRRFPLLARAAGRPATAAALAVTRLVGMECPGQQSLLSAFDLTLDSRADAPELRYEVSSADARFSLVKMRVEGGGLRGTVEAFHRPRPAAQPTWAEALEQVSPGEFGAMRPLVIGGSRGLGAAAALALAAGGASPIITWHHLDQEAARLAAAIREHGADCQVIRWDARNPEEGLAALSGLGIHPTDLLYFATPRIVGRKPSGFDVSLFQRLTEVYVHGLWATHQAVRRLGKGPLRLLVPSTTALDSTPRGLAEYVAAKAASEAAARALGAADRDLRVHISRWPRLDTDQSQSLTPVSVERGTSHVVLALRALRSLA